MVWIQERFSRIRFEDVPGGWVGVATACASAYVTYRLCVYCHYQYRVSQTRRKIQRRQDERTQNVIKTRDRVLSNKDKFDPSITSLEFADLQRRLQKGELKATEVLLAFQYQALQAHQELNCVTEFLDNAMSRAMYLDHAPPHLRGPLHGIPISLKEVVVLEGREATTGFANCIGEKFKDDSVLVKVLIKQGAVPFVRTNLPQGQMSIECSNPIFGMTRNPRNPQKTCGGSSGGEGAMIGAGASVLGLGCDMAGSNRVPSHFCGIAGFKCTPNRLSNVGNFPFGLGIVSLAEVYSPLGRDVNALVEFMKAMLVPKLYQLDPTLPRMPWNHELYEDKEPLKIGYYTWDGGVEPVPAVKRAVMMAVKNLQRMGHTVVEFKPPDLLYMFEHLFMSVLNADDGHEILKAIKYDIVDPCIQTTVQSCERPLPAFMKKLITFLPGMHPLTKILVNHGRPKNIAAWWAKNEEKQNYIRKFCNLMASQGINCLICPVLPVPAWSTEVADFSFEFITYTSLYNVLDFPTGVVPTTTVRSTDLQEMKDYPNHTDVHKFVHEITKDSEDLPVGVQCVGLPFEEETVLRLMKELETSLNATPNGNVPDYETKNGYH